MCKIDFGNWEKAMLLKIQYLGEYWYGDLKVEGQFANGKQQIEISSRPGPEKVRILPPVNKCTPEEGLYFVKFSSERG